MFSVGQDLTHYSDDMSKFSNIIRFNISRDQSERGTRSVCVVSSSSIPGRFIAR
jgi:hypothetical protein